MCQGQREVCTRTATALHVGPVGEALSPAGHVGRARVRAMGATWGGQTSVRAWGAGCGTGRSPASQSGGVSCHQSPVCRLSRRAWHLPLGIELGRGREAPEQRLQLPCPCHVVTGPGGQAYRKRPVLGIPVSYPSFPVAVRAPVPCFHFLGSADKKGTE